MKNCCLRKFHIRPYILTSSFSRWTTHFFSFAKQINITHKERRNNTTNTTKTWFQALDLQKSRCWIKQTNSFPLWRKSYERFFKDFDACEHFGQADDACKWTWCRLGGKLINIESVFTEALGQGYIWSGDLRSILEKREITRSNPGGFYSHENNP